MLEKMVYVIVDELGHYISPRQTEQGDWFYLTYSGDCTGFTFYTNIGTILHEVEALNQLGNEFKWAYIDFRSVPKGKRINNFVKEENNRHLCAQR